MDKEQFQKFVEKPISTETYLLTSRVFSENSADRTLLYGYDCDRNTYHLYLLGDEVRLKVYGWDEEGAPVLITANYGQNAIGDDDLQGIVPNKRLYPEACDYDFCHWLKAKGVNLTFTTYNEARDLSVVFHGEI